MLNKRTGRKGTLVLAVAAVALVTVSSAGASARGREAAPIVIWVSSAEQASIAKSAAAWGKSPVTLAVHDFASIRTDFSVSSETDQQARKPPVPVGSIRGRSTNSAVGSNRRPFTGQPGASAPLARMCVSRA